MRPLMATCVCAAILLAPACSDDSTAPRDALHVVVAGVVETEDGGPREGANVVVSLHHEDGPLLSNVGSAVTDADGAFSIELELDSLPVASEPLLGASVSLEIGSGYPVAREYGRPVEVAGGGETIRHDVVLTRAEDPVPASPGSVLDPDRLLIDMYFGTTVHPQQLGFESMLWMRVDSVSDQFYGRWRLQYAATTVGGEGPFEGAIANDTLWLVLADTANGVPGGNCGGTFDLAVAATSTTADTVIATLTRGTATACHVDEAPFRLSRSPVTVDFE